MKIKLLNDGDFGDMDGVKFPVVVEGVDWEGRGFDVIGSEIIRVGGEVGEWNPHQYYFWSSREVEVIE